MAKKRSCSECNTASNVRRDKSTSSLMNRIYYAKIVTDLPANTTAFWAHRSFSEIFMVQNRKQKGEQVHKRQHVGLGLHCRR